MYIVRIWYIWVEQKLSPPYKTFILFIKSKSFNLPHFEIRLSRQLTGLAGFKLWVVFFSIFSMYYSKMFARYSIYIIHYIIYTTDKIVLACMLIRRIIIEYILYLYILYYMLCNIIYSMVYVEQTFVFPILRFTEYDAVLYYYY